MRQPISAHFVCVLVVGLSVGWGVAAAGPREPLPLPGDGLDVRPYTVTDAGFRKAFKAHMRGRTGRAVQKLEAAQVPAASADYLAATWLRAAGDDKQARRRLERVARGESPLAGRAALALGDLALQRSRDDKARPHYEAAARHPTLRGRAQLALADLHQRAGRRAEARDSLGRALPAIVDVTRRSAALVRHADLLDERGPTCRRRLLHDLYLEGDADDDVRAALAALWGEQADDLAFFRSIYDGRRRDWRRELAGLERDVDQRQGYEAAMLRGILAKQRRRREKAEALVHFATAHRLASTRLREAGALYFKGRTLESLDRDLEAKDIYDSLARGYPEFPLARNLGLRMAQIALREGQPVQALTLLERYLADACPGEDLAEGLWLAGFVAFLADNPDQAGRHWRRLEEEFFFESPSPWVFYGPMAVYWQGKAHLSAGRTDEAVARWELVAREYPGDYYGLLAAHRLEQRGRPAETAAPGRLEESPLALPERLPLSEDFAAAVELFRLGLWEEAFDEAMSRVGQGGLAVGATDLMFSAWLRTHSLYDTIRYRRAWGGLPAPWRQGARAWRLSLPLSFLDALEVGCRDSGLLGALMAAIIRFESNFNPRAASHASAIGLLQVKRDTGNNVAVPCLKMSPVSWRDLRKPELNLRLGGIYVAELIKRHHDNWAVSLAAYNAGPGTASWWLSRFAGLNSDAFVEQMTYPNTVGYVKRILGVTPIYWSLYHPLLGAERLRPGLDLVIPQHLLPFLDEAGGRCDVDAEGK